MHVYLGGSIALPVLYYVTVEHDKDEVAGTDLTREMHQEYLPASMSSKPSPTVILYLSLCMCLGPTTSTLKNRRQTAAACCTCDKVGC